MQKKGKLNTSLQLRWFVLSDLPQSEGGSVLRYYEGRNGVTRTLKGEIRINPAEVSAVRTFAHTGGAGGGAAAEKRLGVRISAAGRVWELVAKNSDAEARHWAELLNARIRVRTARPSMAQMADSTAAQQAAMIGSKESGARPQTTRL